MFSAIETAELDWQQVDGIDVPISKQFGDVYFSKDNGLLETRHVFLNGNDLTERLAQLDDYAYFCVGETGFGTGLNILALWQLWQQVRPDNHSHLHAISVEKFPLSKTDLIRALNAWEELCPLAEQLIAQYPLPISGCHRLHFPEERFSLDLWLGDAEDVFPIIPKTQQVNAWFLDGFAPSCNPELWQQNVLDQIIRLSDVGTTFASFSVAGILKRGLKQHGIQISRPRGFMHKREMLKGIWAHEDHLTQQQARPAQKTIAVLGAGIAGLSTTWAFAQRGHKVHLFDGNGALSGGSGNPLALLNPKLCPIQQSHEHLMLVSWQYALRHYAQFRAFRPLQVSQFDLKNNGELAKLPDQYPERLLSPQANAEFATTLQGICLTHAGAVYPHQLRDEVLTHKNIHFHSQHITALSHDTPIQLLDQKHSVLLEADHVIVCCALSNTQFFENYPVLKPIRGQVSWVNNAAQSLAADQAYSYGGYCMQLNAQELILGASFHPQRDDVEVLEADHQHNLALLQQLSPEYAATLPEISTWQGRASVRAQSQDYFPLLGKPNAEREVYSFAGLGSKGFLYAPLCAEILAAEILGEACPVPINLRQKLQIQRFHKKQKVKKPYFVKEMKTDEKKEL
ncbi:FAD-dependent 5-carboxymethylaminomethyl-2-thiouridine(34) oxidoreductase MnmC [Acinetobacter sp. ANC 4641]|uniref:FAD-dependent 5-carboxymethylaminomethyl-2-thiouridine(34) oxidoreductase MnmC n=1 Tax=Acinetobacter sp. ANC 4641 TaxID=2529847 RepID=UPI00103F3B58|nr:FAD-dependent 5-carboxymethylaminomethyl-2-thiouridine(34) oxidoreductase MnmC [Acinetobacter sp. ANC 4641]TCB08893.1 FAD-dependent oxidoreductase [Acinetobacter sp. ANC 4641]